MKKNYPLPSVVVKKNTTTLTTKTTKDNYSFYSFLKKLSKVVVKKSTLRQRESPQCVIKKSYINLVA